MQSKGAPHKTRTSLTQQFTNAISMLRVRMRMRNAQRIRSTIQKRMIVCKCHVLLLALTLKLKKEVCNFGKVLNVRPQKPCASLKKRSPLFPVYQTKGRLKRLESLSNGILPLLYPSSTKFLMGCLLRRKCVCRCQQQYKLKLLSSSIQNWATLFPKETIFSHRERVNCVCCHAMTQKSSVAWPLPDAQNSACWRFTKSLPLKKITHTKFSLIFCVFLGSNSNRG